MKSIKKCLDFIYKDIFTFVAFVIGSAFLCIAIMGFLYKIEEMLK